MCHYVQTNINIPVTMKRHLDRIAFERTEATGRRVHVADLIRHALSETYSPIQDKLTQGTD